MRRLDQQKGGQSALWSMWTPLWSRWLVQVREAGLRWQTGAATVLDHWLKFHARGRALRNLFKALGIRSP